MEVGLELVSIEDELHVHANRPRMVPERADDGVNEQVCELYGGSVQSQDGRRSSGTGDECFGVNRRECAFLHRPLKTS